jgi:hypothetical protein
VVEHPKVHAGRVINDTEYVLLIHAAPPDWNPSKRYDTGLRLIRTHLRYGIIGAKPNDYIMDDMRWLFTQHPKEPEYWTWNLFAHDDRRIFYKRLIYTWR